MVRHLPSGIIAVGQPHVLSKLVISNLSTLPPTSRIDVDMVRLDDPGVYYLARLPPFVTRDDVENYMLGEYEDIDEAAYLALEESSWYRVCGAAVKEARANIPSTAELKEWFDAPFDL